MEDRRGLVAEGCVNTPDSIHDGRSDGDGDEELVERARSGDRDAFGELVRRHRRRAVGWAGSLTRDPHLAEDVVQDALVRAFIHMGSLSDVQRFLPWLQRIVRNQALMKLRRGGPHGKEQPASTVRTFADGSMEMGDVSLERILDRLIGDRSTDRAHEDPSEEVMRKEILETIRTMIQHLPPKQRAIFEAHFFGELSPKEIALLFTTSPGNVYTTLHRIKARMQRERSRYYVSRYLSKRRDEGTMGKVVLKNENQRLGWTSAAVAVHTALMYTDLSYSLAEVMGYTSHAFRLVVAGDDVGIAGPTSFDWATVISQGLCNLGYHTSSLGQPNGTPPSPEELADAIAKIHKSVDAGRAVIGWDLNNPEFGLIYGYDDEKELLYVTDVSLSKDDVQTLPYARLGNREITELFILTLDEPEPMDRRKALLGALDMAIEHSRKDEKFGDHLNNGLAAYDAWIGAFERQSVEPFGNSYTLAVAADARRYAVLFLDGIAQEWKGAHEEGETVVAMAEEARVHYADVADRLEKLGRRFPFPRGGDPNSAEAAAKAVELLSGAKEEEERGLECLERMRDALRAPR